jgi:DNA helicase-2/ATP-dependent DNA helicase PcrA
MTNLLEQLNEKQREAVVSTEGPVLVLAGAGSGKTRALTYRVAYLIQEKAVHPSNILAVTFTNKAAKEMAERVDKLLASPESRVQSPKLPWLGTFHSICVRILRREAHHLGYDRSFTIYDDQDSQSIIKKIVKELKLDPKKTAPSAIGYFISGAKAELIGPEEYSKLASGTFQKIAAEVYFRYAKALKKAEAMDFDDLILNCVKLFQLHPEVLDKYQRQFKYILIDEYQDTNHAQYMWAKLLASAHKNICVVGDDYQSIYSWRGANFKNILDFEKDYPDATVIKMEQNYRSTKAILAAAQGVIEKNTNRTDKKIWTENQDGLPVTVFEAINDRDEADFVVREIKALKLGGNAAYSDFGILYRTNAQSRIFEETFIHYDMPYQIVGGVSFYQRKEVKDIIAYLRLVYNANDLVSLERIINVPTRGIGPKTVEQFLEVQSPESKAMPAGRQVQSEEHPEKIQKFLEMITDFRKYHENHSIVELIEYISRRSKYKDYLLDGTPEGEARWENIEELQNLAASFGANETNGPNSPNETNEELDNGELETANELGEFLERVSLYQDSEQLNKGRDAVTLMTLHGAKGLEFDTVFLVGMEEGIFPHSRSLTDQDQLEEERRLCYVGMTRARKRLYLLYALERLFHGNLMSSVPSRFIGEIPTDCLDII